MDIAKIRKKAKEQGSGKRPEEPPVPREPGAETVPPVAAEAAEVIAPAAPEEEVPASDSSTKTEKPYLLPESERAEEMDVQIELLTFRLAREEFAFRMDEVEEIVRLQKITRVPAVPSYMVGVTSLRGKIIPVVDLKARLNLRKLSQHAGGGTDPDNEGKTGKILIIAGPEGLIGALIDRVIGVVRLSRQDVLEPPAHLTEAEKKFIEGIVIFDKRFISVIRSADTMGIEIG
jgi:purine-binding chemotaxis protein CheW